MDWSWGMRLSNIYNPYFLQLFRVLFVKAHRSEFDNTTFVPVLS